MGRTFPGMISLLVFVLLLPLNSIVSPQARSGDEAVRAALDGRHKDLLIEKGICDERGREIDGRLGRIIETARRSGRSSEQEILQHVLDALHFSESHFAGFPACSFDRPIGYELVSFGRTIAPENIEARKDGSACPLGGIGAGAFERLMNGNFHTWFLKPGWMVEDTVWANQFHVFMKTGEKAIAQTLSTKAPPETEGLGTWAWKYPVGKGDYFALFPKSGFSYEENTDWPVDLACVQFSPVIPHNYRETSYPVAVFKWIARNNDTAPVDVSLLLTWENMVGWEAVQASPPNRQASFVWNRASEGNVNEFIEAGTKKGILFRKEGQSLKTGPALAGSMAIAVNTVPGKVGIHYQTTFDPRSDGGDIWTSFSYDGTLSGSHAAAAPPEGGTAAALAVQFTLEPGERIEVPFVVAWDFPFYEFEGGARYRKKYTAFFGADGGNAFRIASEGLEHWREWEKAVDDWQATIVRDPNLPGWFKQALLNELYVLAETSIWDAETDLHTYLESADYLMYGTFDVDAYCWHVLKLWPELEFNHMKYMAGTVPLTDSSYKSYLYAEVMPDEVPEDKKDYYWNTNKVAGMVPHDIGSPRKRPWVILNAFDWQNGNVWKDLNPKFPLRAYRDFLAMEDGDTDFLKKMLEASVLALDTLERRFGDRRSHLPLNEGIPDQTYDTWRMKGESAFVSLLWLAALKATIAMGETLVDQGISRAGDCDIPQILVKYREWYEVGRRDVQKLWDEEAGYFHIDASTDDIMTDQLFGVWYASMLGLEDKNPIIPAVQARRTLRTVFANNVLGFGDGLMGAVNGRKADGSQLFSQQGDEVWVGTSFAFAANCLQHGMWEEAMRTCYGLYHVIYSPFGQGYFFKTPEAYLNPDEGQWNNPAEKYGNRLFRAMKYMRPGAVWAVYEALNRSHEEE